jgi:hypothetical protein
MAKALQRYLETMRAEDPEMRLYVHTVVAGVIGDSHDSAGRRNLQRH